MVRVAIILLLSFLLAGAVVLFTQRLSDRDEPGTQKPQPQLGKFDLDVTYIERTPRYERYCVIYEEGVPLLCPGTQQKKRWPHVGEAVMYTAHLMNKGDASSPSFSYRWLVDGVEQMEAMAENLAPGAEATFSLIRRFPEDPEQIQFVVASQGVPSEERTGNNTLTAGSHDLTFAIFVERGLYDLFNRIQNLVGTRSFEDWIQAHFAKMNERFGQARYEPFAPKGILDRVRIDTIAVVEDLDKEHAPHDADADLYLLDGRWKFRDGDPENTVGSSGAWQDYVTRFAATIDWGLVHELAHQLGIIDLYRLNLRNDPTHNNGFFVQDRLGDVISASRLPTVAWNQILFKYPGIMAGGDTSPYRDQTYFESHTTGGMNAHAHYRRGYYGEYLFDTPVHTYGAVFDAAGRPLEGVTVAFYQKDASTESIDNIPEITELTDKRGIVVLPNRPVRGVTTATGHTLKPNPFGQIHVTGTNGTMFVKVTKGEQESYAWLLLHDLNLAYWSGEKESVVLKIATTIR